MRGPRADSNHAWASAAGEPEHAVRPDAALPEAQGRLPHAAPAERLPSRRKKQGIPRELREQTAAESESAADPEERPAPHSFRPSFEPRPPALGEHQKDPHPTAFPWAPLPQRGQLRQKADQSLHRTALVRTQRIRHQSVRLGRAPRFGRSRVQVEAEARLHPS